jgi:hypothetical protein
VAAESASNADADADAVDGLTLEWAVEMPAVGGAVPDDLPVVTSPYPLLDTREGVDAEEDS